ncbi:MAG: gephyrin-like molybdotransferase Glp [bacterium]
MSRAPLALTLAEARARVLAAARALPPERVPVRDAVGRALREDVIAPHDLPAFRNSAMDGFAVRSTDLAGASDATPVTLRVVSVLPAGTAATRALGPGEAARIMTGAPVPQGADAMVPFEDAERVGAGADERCVVRRAATPGDHLRAAGADLAHGARALAAGTRLHARNLALLGALGVSAPLVGPRPRVAVLSTGDELLDLEAALRPGAVRDSNGPMLAQLVEDAGGRVGTHRRLPDDPAEVERAVRAALAEHDVVLTVGGVSAGDHDPVRAALDAIGDVEAWRVAMRPGRPQAFGTPGGRLFVGLPGNPASVVCVFEVLVRPALLALQGHATLDRPRAPVVCGAAVPSRAGRTDLVRCTLAWRDGRLVATPTGAQVSGHLTPQASAHALLVVPEQADALAAGDAAEAIVWELP